MSEFEKSYGRTPLYPPGTGISNIGGGVAGKGKGANRNAFTASYPMRPASVLDFIVDNALPGGGLLPFNVEANLLEYTAPSGYVAVVNSIEWYITPQNNNIDPAQLSMRLFLDGASLQGTDTMGIGQAGILPNLSIAVKQGAVLTVKLGRGPAVVQYTTTAVQRFRANGDPNGFTAFAEAATGVDNKIASINGVLYVWIDGAPSTIWRSYDGVSFTLIATVTFAGGTSLTAFKNYLVIQGGGFFYYSINGVFWTLGNGTVTPADLVNPFEFNGGLWAWAASTQSFWATYDLGLTWVQQPIINLERDLIGFGTDYKCTVLAGNIYAVRNNSTTPTNMSVWKSPDGETWTQIKNSTTINGIALWDGRIGFFLTNFNNLIYVGAGFGGAGYSQIYSSPEGVVWNEFAAASLKPSRYASVTVSSALGFVVHANRDNAGVTPNNALYGIGLFPAIYDPELKCYCQMKGQLIRAKGDVNETLVNPL